MPKSKKQLAPLKRLLEPARRESVNRRRVNGEGPGRRTVPEGSDVTKEKSSDTRKTIYSCERAGLATEEAPRLPQLNRWLAMIDSHDPSERRIAAFNLRDAPFDSPEVRDVAITKLTYLWLLDPVQEVAFVAFATLRHVARADLELARRLSFDISCGRGVEVPPATPMTPIDIAPSELSTKRVIRNHEAAVILGVSKVRVNQLAKQGRIGALVDGRYLFSERELDAFKKLDRPTGVPLANRRVVDPDHTLEVD